MDIELIKAFFMGIVQGITEFFPISSTAHLILMPKFFGWTGQLDSLSFDIALHAGTLASLLVCFCKDWIEIFKNNRKLLLYLAIGTIPAGIAGVFFKDTIETALRHPGYIAAALVAGSIIMIAAEKYGSSHQRKQNAGMFDALFIGIAQAIALIPGISRSGITISAGLFRNIDRASAARFSFLLSTPAIAGAALLEARHMISTQSRLDLDMVAVGFGAAFISGLLAIKFLMSFLKKHPLNIFIYYRLALAAAILLAYLLM
ncbi:MAG: undecaprenyl-diphosphate phosphatase [Nitrospirae bacterium]|nr:undecaprenyl-diphosphate phosphatase [Nitrospirota bacterium]